MGVSCPGKYALTYDHAAPIFTCGVCGHQDLTWAKFYNEYLQLYKTRENWMEPKNHVSCVVGFFAHMYKERYSIDYTFVPRNPSPYTSKECIDALTLLAAFNKDAEEVRRYIYWIFTKAINDSTNITSLGYLIVPGLIRKYKLYASKRNVLCRETKLPPDLIEWCNLNVPEVFSYYALDTMNDLGALLNYVVTYDADLKPDVPERRVLAEAGKYGLISNNKLNIGVTDGKANRK